MKTNFKNGVLFTGDMLKIVPDLELVDLIFCDPPFNLNKDYKSKINDSLKEEEYLKWCEQWIKTLVPKLKEGGSFFLFNIPKWNIHLSQMLFKEGLVFRHWIAIDMTLGLPIKNKLYPSHYSLLYFTKGKPSTFTPERLPIEACRHCGKDIKDYGGHRHKINKEGLNLKDIWVDIGKVTGKKNRKANELPEKLMERILKMSSKEGDTILDPFSGSGTTLAVANRLNRKFIGIELDDGSDIINRLKKA